MSQIEFNFFYVPLFALFWGFLITVCGMMFILILRYRNLRIQGVRRLVGLEYMLGTCRADTYE